MSKQSLLQSPALHHQLNCICICICQHCGKFKCQSKVSYFRKHFPALCTSSVKLVHHQLNCICICIYQHCGKFKCQSKVSYFRKHSPSLHHQLDCDIKMHRFLYALSILTQAIYILSHAFLLLNTIEWWNMWTNIICVLKMHFARFTSWGLN